jgi:hypothetical protein
MDMEKWAMEYIYIYIYIYIYAYIYIDVYTIIWLCFDILCVFIYEKWWDMILENFWNASHSKISVLLLPQWVLQSFSVPVARGKYNCRPVLYHYCFQDMAFWLNCGY